MKGTTNAFRFSAKERNARKGRRDGGSGGGIERKTEGSRTLEGDVRDDGKDGRHGLNHAVLKAFSNENFYYLALFSIWIIEMCALMVV